MTADPRTGHPLAPGAPLAWFVGIENTCVHPRRQDSFDPLDEHQLTGHDEHWEADARFVSALGVCGLRYGMSWPTVHKGPGRYDWQQLDARVERLAADHGLWLIADLVHFGCPPWLDGSFLDDRFVGSLAEFADALLDRYGSLIPAITPINEPLTTAAFCGLRQIWPPAVGNRTGWAQIAASLAEAYQAVFEIARGHGAEIVHVEAGHDYETCDEALQDHTALLNELGYVPTDLALGRLRGAGWVPDWLIRHGVEPSRLARLTGTARRPDYFGLNYYPDLTPRVLIRHEGEVAQLTADRGATGLATLVRDRARRYGLPILVTETSIEGDEQCRVVWLEAAAAEIAQLRREGIDVRGLTWWPLIDFVDWSVVAAGRDVEEFLATRWDPATRELAPAEPSPAGAGTRIRRMGLVHLERTVDGVTSRRETAVSDRFRDLAIGSEGPEGPPRLWSAGAAVEARDGSALSLDGTWEFRPADGDASGQPWGEIEVPGLWEAQGHAGFDGSADYRYRFRVPDPSGHWTLRFGAVMDTAEVCLNDVLLGSFDLPFAPFECDVSRLLRRDANVIEVTVTDPPTGSPAHLAGPHGKQGWANHEFPSPPSMYLTYGGIWQSVTLRRHGPVAIRDIWSNLDPDDAEVAVEVHNLADAVAHVTIRVTLGALTREATAVVPPRARRTCVIGFGSVALERWSPHSPHQHACRAVVSADGQETDAARIDVGFRTVEVDESGLVLNGEPFLMRAALVQGFDPDHLYADGSTDAIRREVQEAMRLGFNTLRLHFRAFSPEYLQVCDRLGMLLYCDLGVGEPIGYDQLDGHGPVTRAYAAALVAQVRRDRRHPSIVLWSCMNEVGLHRPSFRRTGRYRAFATALVRSLREVDRTRPFIENDWLEPDPEGVATSPPVLTAHWYGNLSRAWLEDLAGRTGGLADLPEPVLVSEFGDWGLPDPDSTDGRFYSHRSAYEAALAQARWPESLEEFSRGTQVHQGIADRLQIDLFRRAGNGVAGYCLTQLTDVPLEFNGVLDILRRPKFGAAWIGQANQEVSPMLVLDDFGGFASSDMPVEVWVANDSDRACRFDVTVDSGRGSHPAGSLRVAARQAARLGVTQVRLDGSVGETEITVAATDDRGRVWRSSYPVLIHRAPVPRAHRVALTDSPVDSPAAVGVLEAAGVEVVGPGVEAEMLLVPEESLTAGTADQVRRLLRDGRLVVILAQGPEASFLYPTQVTIRPIGANWGGTPFRFTTREAAVAAYPPTTVLHVHDADIAPEAVIATPGTPPDAVAVGVFKPPPRPATGVVVSATRCRHGTAVYCQYRLFEAIARGSPTAVAVMSDLLSWAKERHAITILGS